MPAQLGVSCVLPSAFQHQLKHNCVTCARVGVGVSACVQIYTYVFPDITCERHWGYSYRFMQFYLPHLCLNSWHLIWQEPSRREGGSKIASVLHCMLRQASFLTVGKCEWRGMVNCDTGNISTFWKMHVFPWKGQNRSDILGGKYEATAKSQLTQDKHWKQRETPSLLVFIQRWKKISKKQPSYILLHKKP